MTKESLVNPLLKSRSKLKFQTRVAEKKIVKTSIFVVASVILVSFLLNSKRRFDEDLAKRGRNIERDRLGPLHFVNTWTNALFYRQFRMPREDYYRLRENVKLVARPVNSKFAILSSGSVVPLETKLLVTLRILAGANYLDMVWYGVPENHVETYVMEIVGYFNKCSLLDTIHVPTTSEDLAKCAAEWEAIQMQKFNKILVHGTVLAGELY